MLRTKLSSQSMRMVCCGYVILIVASVIGCRGPGHTHKPSNADEQTLMLAVVESVVCSETSPLPPKQYRPQFAPGVVPVIVVNPKYAQPGRFEIDGATQLRSEELSALKEISADSGEVSLAGSRFKCDVQPMLDSKGKWSWETFPRLFPGGLGWVSLSRARLNATGDTGYIYSHTQWGPLQGESDLWVLSRGPHNEWKVVHMYPLSRS
jgi:hypothetical protein